MNRFDPNYSAVGEKIAFWLPIAAFAIPIALFLGGVNSVGSTTDAKQLEGLKTALARSISQCYAVEGRYPEDLQYLKEHYGLTYDETAFLVDYDSLGGNLIPEVTVLKKSNR